MHTCTPDEFCKRIEVSRYDTRTCLRLGQIRTQIGYSRVWGALFRTAGRGERGRAYLVRVLVAGEGPGGDVSKGVAARQVAVAAGKEGHERGGEESRTGGRKRRGAEEG